MKDLIVEEVRKYRMEHTRKFDGCLKAICEDLRAVQKTYGVKVVRLPARRMEPAPQTGRRRTNPAA
ncbi:MAG: hypothetical protein AB1714_28035 [Acidobacteriota bacterium]